MSYKIIVLDIDGTLTNSKKEISPATSEGLIDIQSRGYKVVLASGRPTPGITPLAKQLKLADYGSYILAYNGGKIIDCKSNETIYQKTLPPDCLPTLFSHAKDAGLGLLTYEDQAIICGTKTNKYMEIESKIVNLPIKEVPNFCEYIDFSVNKCLMTGEPDEIAAMEDKLKKVFNGYLNIFRSEPFFLEIMPQGIDKAHSLLKLLNSIGLTSKEMICCGDGFNDISMISIAGLGVAMENAQDCVKNAADYITKSNDDDGVLYVIKKFMS